MITQNININQNITVNHIQNNELDKKQNKNPIQLKAKTQSRNNSPNAIIDATNNVHQPINNVK